MTPITSILDDLRIPWRGEGHRDVRRGWVGLECPWCGRGPDKLYLGINLANAYAVCWSCGPHRLGDVLAEASGRPLREVLPLIEGLQGPRRPEAAPRPRGRLKVPPGVGPLLGPHRRYLKGRGFDPEAVAGPWGVRGIGLEARLAWRLWVPIRRHGETVSWTTRATGDVGVRYVAARPEEEALPARSLLYGGDMAGGSVVLVEGPLDAWAVGPGAVSTLGVAWTREQMAELARYPLRAVCPDSGGGEHAARRRYRELCEEVRSLPGTTVMVKLEHGKDPAGLLLSAEGRAELDTLRKEFLL